MIAVSQSFKILGVVKEGRKLCRAKGYIGTFMPTLQTCKSLDIFFFKSRYLFRSSHFYNCKFEEKTNNH